LESHIKLRKGTEAYTKVQENVIDVMKKTLGVMVFEVLYPQFDFSGKFFYTLLGSGSE
jgi:hypothetical protein